MKRVLAIMRSAPVPPRRAALAGMLGLMIVIPFLLRLLLIEHRGFDPDEFEHLHFAWCISQGKLPYRDYFDHHTPWLHFMLAPLFKVYDATSSADAALGLIFAARRLMWVCAGAVLALTFALARSCRGERAAWASTLLLANTGIFLSKTVEIRPDVPATALVVGSLLLGIHGWRRAASAAGAAWLFLASGLALGAASMFTQKVLFLGPGLALAAGWLVADPRSRMSLTARLGGVGAQALGFALPVAITLGYFQAQGALGQFVRCNFVVNARWPGLGPRDFVLVFLREDTAFAVLAGLGFVIGASRLRRPEAATRGEPLLALALASPVFGLFVHPAVTFHYFLLFLPQAAVYAGSSLVLAAERLAAALRRPGAPTPGATRRWLTSPEILIGILAVVLSLQPLLRLRKTFQRGNWSTLQGIRYVIRNVAPWETTFDGFSGLGVFRPQAFFYPFQHWHTFAIQSEAEHRYLLEALETGIAIPKLVFWDRDLRQGVTPEVAAFIETHYVRHGPEPIRVRPFDNGLGWWSDEGPRPLGWVRGQPQAPHLLFGEGWRDPGLEDDVPCRRSRTRTSELIVPVRHPGDFRAVLRAKADREPGPFTLELLVNGMSAGHLTTAPRWQDYAFLVPRRYLRPGFNRFQLQYSGDPAEPERKRELAVEFLALYRLSGPLAATADSGPGGRLTPRRARPGTATHTRSGRSGSAPGRRRSGPG